MSNRGPAPNALDLTGHKFGLLTVLHRVPPGPTQRWRSVWLCQCECGGTVSVVATSLRKGGTKSCGCLKLAQMERFKTSSITHGKRNTPEYRTWADMCLRCDTPSQTSYPRYGGKGIKVCDRWKASFEVFLADMGPKPSPLHSIERNNSAGNYEPENCRWATRAEQAANKSTTVRVVWQGAEVVACVLAKQLGKNPKIVCGRLAKGWTIERALSQPVGARA